MCMRILTNRLSLDILGEAVHLHPAYLSKVFKEETNINLSNYITGYPDAESGGASGADGPEGE